MYRLANVSDSSSTNFHPCTEGSNQTVPTFFSEDSYTCNDQFMRLFEDPDVVLEAKNGSYVIIVSATICVFVSAATFGRFCTRQDKCKRVTSVVCPGCKRRETVTQVESAKKVHAQYPRQAQTQPLMKANTRGTFERSKRVLFPLCYVLSCARGLKSGPGERRVTCVRQQKLSAKGPHDTAGY